MKFIAESHWKLFCATYMPYTWPLAFASLTPFQYVPFGHSYSAILSLCISILRTTWQLVIQSYFGGDITETHL